MVANTLLAFAAFVAVARFVEGNENNSTEAKEASCFPVSPGFSLNGTGADPLPFALSLFRSVYTEGENVFVSPASISQALHLALFASRGDTEAELREALFIPKELAKGDILAAYKMDHYFRATGCNRSSSGVELHLTNKYFVDQGENLTNCALSTLGPELEALPLATDPTASTAHINAWVEGETRGKIRALLPPLPHGTRLALANSAYFRGTWEQQFKKRRTKLGLFYVSPNEVVPTQLMTVKGNFAHGVSTALQSYLLLLPYEGGSLSMLIILPPFGALNETLGRLDAKSLREGMEELTHDSIEVVLPRFKLGGSYALTSALKGMGINSLFNATGADLSELSLDKGLSLQEAVHKSYIEVNEEGATAAAATALIGTRSGRPLEQTRFVANHPFIFLIYDHCTSSVLFMGSLHKPTPTS